jgi:hypothetical protein
MAGGRTHARRTVSPKRRARSSGLTPRAASSETAGSARSKRRSRRRSPTG